MYFGLLFKLVMNIKRSWFSWSLIMNGLTYVYKIINLFEIIIILFIKYVLWTSTLLLDYWEIDGVFRVNISTIDIDLWETKWFVPWFIYVMSNWLDLVWIWIRCISVELTPNKVIRFREMHLLVSWCVGGECDMAGSDEDRGRSGRFGAEDQGWSDTSRIPGGQTIRTSCMIRIVHVEETKSAGFPV
jgi:hypothetical protein